MRRAVNMIVTLVIAAGTALLGVFVFRDSYLRFGESARDLALSLAYYFCRVFGIESGITATVNGYSEVFSWGTVLPEDFGAFREDTADYFTLLFDAENLAGWWNGVVSGLGTAAKVLMIALPCIVVLVLLVRRLYRSGNTRHNKDTLPLKAFKAVAKVTYQPVKRFVLSYGYDWRRYGHRFDDALKINTLFDVLETYALAYFIYIMQSSLIMANYSIRTDNRMLDNGNFPLWLTDFFPRNRRSESRHAHILDFDVLRLGRKVLENNPRTGSFEFGVVAITEIGKERGNNLELKEVKKGADDTNQKNDLFNSWLKMCRHSATVDNIPFIKVFTDEQRPESWGADTRDLCDVVHIVSSGEQKLTLPFYTIEEMVSEWAFERFIRLYEDFRFRRGDNTLLVHILKSVTAWLWRRNLRVYNRYGYCILKIEKERGTMDGKTESKKYFIMNGKIYARRFATDCFSDYFNDMARKSGAGLNGYAEYMTEKASVAELKRQNSYFINALYGNAGESSAER